jgi:hypothetical protein
MLVRRAAAMSIANAGVVACVHAYCHVIPAAASDVDTFAFVTVEN